MDTKKEKKIRELVHITEEKTNTSKRRAWD